VKGLIWLRIGPAVWLKKGRVSSRAGPSVRAAGVSLRSAGAEASENRFELRSARCVSRSAEGASRRVSRIAASWFANPRSAALDESTHSASYSSFRPSSSATSRKL
jgi:hypothetical protein